MESEELKRKGEEGEFEFNKWLQKNKLCYLYINQSQDYFATLFPGNLKRPDFLVLLESIGLIAVDTKNCRLFTHYKDNAQCYTLKYEKELRRVLTFERLFHIPVWYAFLNQTSEKTSWHWMSALQAVEVGDLIKPEKGEDFLAIRCDQFALIETNKDLGKLYTQRMPSLNNIHNLDN